MNWRRFITLGMVAAMVAFSFSASSQAQNELIETLTCSPDSKGELQTNWLRKFEKQAQIRGEGWFVIEEEITGDGICIRNAHVGGSFGVFLLVPSSVARIPRRLLILLGRETKT
jgi:hypothetical protein